MKTKGSVYVADYEHSGDSDHYISIISKIDPKAVIDDVHVSLTEEYEEYTDEADCEECIIYFTFDYDKVNEFKKEFSGDFDYIVPKNVPTDSTIVYVTKTGKSYKLKQDKRWSIAKKLNDALAEGMYLYASKK